MCLCFSIRVYTTNFCSADMFNIVFEGSNVDCATSHVQNRFVCKTLHEIQADEELLLPFHYMGEPDAVNRHMLLYYGFAYPQDTDLYKYYRKVLGLKEWELV